MPFQLYDYQTRLAEQGDAAMLQGLRPDIVSGTGSGKTVILAELVARALARGERVVVICHRASIHRQIVAAIRHHCPRVVVAMITAGAYPRLDRRVTVAMVKTLAKRLDQLGPLQGCTLLVDEGHHLDAPEWRAALTALAPARYLLLTATPIRPDGRGMGDTGLVDVMFKGPPVNELMAMKALCPDYQLIACRHAISSKGLKKSKGDYAKKDMEARVVEINGYIVSDWLTLLPARLQTITVAVSVDHAHEVAELYNAAGIPAAAIDGRMPEKKCEAIIKQYEEGRILVLVACAKVDEGLDLPNATVLQLLRPIDSLRLWKQLVGRVIRKANGKNMFYIMDHTDTWSKPHLGMPDQEIDWQLNAQKQEPVKRLRLVRDEDTGLVRSEGELLPVEVQQNGSRMEVITRESLARCHPITARRMINQKCRQELDYFFSQWQQYANAAGNINTSHGRQVMALGDGLRRWLGCLDVLEDEILDMLERVPGLRLPPGWAQGQKMVRLLLTNEQRLAATKRLQRTWLVS